ncbi:EAL domain-containing protein [Mangrovicella endophytica]|uniref:EAL domain-containing protein n=1 Tax=Mangrovicella endophytica TaxID=2066697 RepID=UPI000C9EC2E9|nr:EAL domain-containing protein [Mangrovicella endophytica]
MAHGCEGCRSGAELDFTFSMAFQPIYDVAAERVWGYEALIRGTAGEGAYGVLSKVAADQKYRFDQACRVKAIELASALFPQGADLRLSINFMPNAVYEPAACLRATLAAAKTHRFPLNSIMFEFTEAEEIVDTDHLTKIITEYRRRGFITALDDFGAGFAGLGLLADFQPDLIKIDMKLVRDVDTSRPRQAILAAVLHIARELGITVLAEGVETEAEFLALKAAGIRLFQGYYFAKPAFEALPPIGAGAAVAA